MSQLTVKLSDNGGITSSEVYTFTITVVPGVIGYALMNLQPAAIAPKPIAWLPLRIIRLTPSAGGINFQSNWLAYFCASSNAQRATARFASATADPFSCRNFG